MRITSGLSLAMRSRLGSARVPRSSMPAGSAGSRTQVSQLEMSQAPAGLTPRPNQVFQQIPLKHGRTLRDGLKDMLAQVIRMVMPETAANFHSEAKFGSDAAPPSNRPAGRECPEIFFTMKEFCSARKENLPLLQSHDMCSKPQCQIDVVNDRNNAASRFTIKAPRSASVPRIGDERPARKSVRRESLRVKLAREASISKRAAVRPRKDHQRSFVHTAPCR